MSVRFLPTCLIPAALVAAALVTDILAPRPGLRAGDNSACCVEKMETRTYAVADLVIPCGNTCGTTSAPCPQLAPPPACTSAAAPCSVSVEYSAEPIPAPKPQDAACGSRACPAVTATACPPIPRAASFQHCPPPGTTEKALMQLIVHSVAPETWEAKGGKGSIDYFPLTMSLVVRQTPVVQEQIADLLAALRRHQDVQVALEVRFVTVSEGFGERIGIDFECNQAKEPKASCPTGCPADDDGKVVFLNDKQVIRFLEGVQGDQRANVMQAPKLTMLNGQCSTLDVTGQKTFVTGLSVRQVNGDVVCIPQNEVITTGVQMNVQPVVSADRRFVRLYFNANLCDLDSPEADLLPVMAPVTPKGADGSTNKPVLFTQFIQKPRLHKVAIDKTLCIPEGGTAVLSAGKRVRQVRTEYGPPTLSKIPYVNRMFKNVGYGRETENLLVLVTPRVIVSEEVERQTGFDELEEMCGNWSEEPAKRGTPVCGPDGCKDKNGPAGSVKVLDPHSPNGFRELLITVGEQHTGSFQIGAGVSSAEGFTGSIIINEHNFGFTSCEVAGLLEKYHKACAEGRHAEATALAVKALAIDPLCFHKSAGCKGEK
jgi:general secretion pathway protein D